MSLSDVTVIDFSTGISGPYATKLFVDAGATVIKVETTQGDPLRRWSASGAELGESDSALFQYLSAGKLSVVGQPGDQEILELVAGAHLLVEDATPELFDALQLEQRFPALVRLSISPWGRNGPYVGRPATEFTLQAEAGSVASRGLAGAEPFQAGGRVTEWVAGANAAVAALAALRGVQQGGVAEHIDFSLLEATNVVATNYADLFAQLMGPEVLRAGAASVESPSIEPTLDGYVGFCTNTAQQFSDFLLLIERPDLRDDPELSQMMGRAKRFDEWTEIVHSYTKRQRRADLIERSSLLRIPVAPVNDGASVSEHEQLVARGVYRADSSGRFLIPRVPYQLDFRLPPPPGPAPRLGEHTGKVAARAARTLSSDAGAGLPLAGIRILDVTAWWAGPAAPHLLATLGADVIHVEAIQRPDGMRMSGGMLRGRVEDWWECSPFFATVNTNKRGITLNLGDPEGVELLKRLAAKSDLLIENFTPRVFDSFGIDWETLHALNPRLIFLRMPAFGLSGPWRDYTGFAQTMEQLSGMAWRTGHVADQPRIPRGPCDPNAGLHAAFAALVALAERDRTGEGSHVESTMVEAALNVAAEVVIEHSAYGAQLERLGNRAYEAAPQGLYACAGGTPERPNWLALSVAEDSQWRALKRVLGSPPWADPAELENLFGRRSAHDEIDAQLKPWFAERELEATVDLLLAAGVPAACVNDPRLASQHPQLVARKFFEEVEHPKLGLRRLATMPFRFAGVEHWTRSPAPTLGQHNRDVLGELGISEEEIARLEEAEVIGSRPTGL